MNTTEFMGDSWDHVPGNLCYVSAGQAGVWGLNSSGDIFYSDATYKNPRNGGAQWVPVNGAATCVASGATMVWCITSTDEIFYRDGITPMNPIGTKWVIVDGKAKQIYVSSVDNSVWIVNSSNKIYRCIGIGLASPTGVKWEKLDGELKCVTTGYAGVWGVNSSGKIFFRQGTGFNDGNDEKGSKWTLIPGKLKSITSGNGVVWGANDSDDVYFRLGLGPHYPVGIEWHKLKDGQKLKQVSVCTYSNAIWGVDSKDSVFRRNIRV